MSENDMPALGSTEAAVRSYVNLFCKATGLREDVTAYWLDCYYQIRSMHEEKRAPIITEKLIPPVKVEGLSPEEAGRKDVTALADLKKIVLARIEAYKRAGISYGMMCNSCGQAFGMSLLLDAVNASMLSERQWKALDRGLKKVAIAHSEILTQTEGTDHE